MDKLVLLGILCGRAYGASLRDALSHRVASKLEATAAQELPF